MAEYIERDSVLNIVKGNWSFMNSADDAIQTSIEMIRRLPAADVRPVVHGKRLDRSSGWTFNSECNKCGFIVHEQFIKTYKYCPNCGADMRGEKDV